MSASIENGHELLGSVEDRIPDDFQRHQLDGVHSFYSAFLPKDLQLRDEAFETVWGLHPDNFHEVMMHGRLVKLPRWQQAYGMDYHYTGRVNKARPVPDILHPLHAWCSEAIEARLNGILLNWYDGVLGHYIGRHRDSTTNMVYGAPIVTISFGERRTFRLRPWKQQGKRDFAATNGSIFVMPFETNLAWTHEVPRSAKLQGRRISVTLRAFEA